MHEIIVSFPAGQIGGNCELATLANGSSIKSEITATATAPARNRAQRQRRSKPGAPRPAISTRTNGGKRSGPRSPPGPGPTLRNSAGSGENRPNQEQWGARRVRCVTSGSGSGLHCMSRSIWSSRPPWGLLIFFAGGRVTLDLGGRTREEAEVGRRETRGGEEGAGQKVLTVARDGGYIIAVFRGRDERCGRTSGVP
jgi:hypothetical protein